MAGWARYFVACSCCLSTPPFGEFSFLCQSKMERGNFGRTQPDTLARSPPPQPCHLGRWPARQPAASSERPSLLLDSFRGDNAVWLFTAPGRASWLQSQLAAAWARSPASLGPRSGCLCSGPTVARLFFSLPPSFFVRWQIWVFFLVSFLSFSLPFSFPWSTREAREKGRLGEL